MFSVLFIPQKLSYVSDVKGLLSFQSYEETISISSLYVRYIKQHLSPFTEGKDETVESCV